MLRQLSFLLGSTVLAATLSLTAAAQEKTNNGLSGRKPGDVPPKEKSGIRTPGGTDSATGAGGATGAAGYGGSETGSKGMVITKYNNYGIYTSVIEDDTLFWRMGGNGLVPYGTPRPPHLGPPDLVDMIQGTRGQGGSCGSAPIDISVLPVPASAAPTPDLPPPTMVPPASR